MPATLRERIGDALWTALQALAPDYRLWRGETRMPTEAEMPVVNLLVLDHRPVSQATSAWEMELTVQLDGWIGGADGPALERAIAGVYGAVLTAVSADTSLGGLADDVREVDFVVSHDTTEGHAPYANATLELVVPYGQAEADPYTQAP